MLYFKIESACKRIENSISPKTKSCARHEQISRVNVNRLTNVVRVENVLICFSGEHFDFRRYEYSLENTDGGARPRTAAINRTTYTERARIQLDSTKSLTILTERTGETQKSSSPKRQSQQRFYTIGAVCSLTGAPVVPRSFFQPKPEKKCDLIRHTYMCMYILLAFRKTYLFSAVDQYGRWQGLSAFRLPLRVTDGRFLRAQFPRITFEDGSFVRAFSIFHLCFFRARVTIYILNRNTDGRRRSPGRSLVKHQNVY